MQIKPGDRITYLIGGNPDRESKVLIVNDDKTISYTDGTSFYDTDDLEAHINTMALVFPISDKDRASILKLHEAGIVGEIRKHQDGSCTINCNRGWAIPLYVTLDSIPRNYALDIWRAAYPPKE